MTLQNTLSDILADGLRTLGRNQYESRLGICRLCENSKMNAFGLTCSLCGCNMNLKAKFVASCCPENHWERIDETNAQ